MWTREAEDVTMVSQAQPRLMSQGEAAFLQKVTAMVRSHLGDADFTTEDAAAELGMSRMHLNRLLRRLTGQSTHDFLLSARLRSAGALLLARPLPIHVIAELVGFRSHPHFAKAFHQATGMRPSEYRRAHSRLRSSIPPQPAL
jgi:transcriptional regulator GlxA family with amidase domain